MSMCRVFFSVVGRECLIWPVHSLGRIQLAFALFGGHLVAWRILFSKAKVACYSRYLLTSYFCILIPYDEKDIFFWILVLEHLVGLHRTIQFQLLQRYWLGHRLELLWYWMVCLGNRDHSVIFEIASKDCISDSFVYYHGYFISSKGFLPTVVVGQDVVVVGCSRCSLRYNGHLS